MLGRRPCDVETAGCEEPPSPRSVSSGTTERSSTVASAVEPIPSEEGEAIAEQVKAERWQCDLCFEPFLKFETPWRLGDECNHSLCRRCVLGSIRWGGRCPYDNTPIPAIVVCGAMGTGEYVYHEKLTEARRTGGVPCSVSDCPGVAPSSGRPAPSSCNCCGARHCGRILCGVPWSAGHRCWDMEQEEVPIPRGHDFQVTTRRRLMSAPRFRPCPQCGVMVEHSGGCNMIYHDTCRTRWCFICRRVGTCQDFDCKAPGGSQPPTPRGPAPLERSTERGRKALSSSAALMTGMVLLFLLITANFFSGLHGLNMPRKGLPFFLSTARYETCEDVSCDTGESTSTLSENLLRPASTVSLEV